MATSSVISWFKSPEEQALIEDLINESITLYGYDIYYLPREAVRDNDMFGEDVLSRYPDAIQIEAYIENIEGFGGMGDQFSKFGIEINDMISFVIGNRRWDEVRREGIMSEEGWAINLESANTSEPGRQDVLLLDGGEGYDYSNQVRPNEGDLIWFPLVSKFFEIRFVEHEKMFYPLGRRMVYVLKCELFQGSSERVETGISEIDSAANSVSLDILGNSILLEDGGHLLNETGGYLLLEDIRIENVEPQANNELFDTDVTGIADFSEKNPFSRWK